MDKVLIQRVILRFIRGFVSSFVATGIFIIPSNISTLVDLRAWFISLGVMAFVAGISGGLLSLDLSIREFLKPTE